MTSINEKHNAVDLSHHISALSNARISSPLKSLQKYFLRPGMISLAGGMPDPSLFPFETISADAIVPPPAKSSSSLFSWFFSLFGGTAPKTQSFTIAKYPAQSGDICLAEALQYTAATGLQQLQDFVKTFTGQIHAPAYADWTTLVDVGNTDGIYKTISTLCNPGEMLLVEEWTYPSTLFATHPMAVRPAPVPIDAEGLSAAGLERVLAEWDEAARGAKRPHVLYTVPIGQNPTGATMSLARKQAVYAVCVKYDVVIIEDDPYFFLQEGPWRTKAERKSSDAPANLAPSFLKVDTQGRVVRLDSFSKIIAPGSRLGWITANPLFAERIERQSETTTQAPCGFAQALITQLVTQHWAAPDLARWFRSLQADYTARRDFIVDALFSAFDVRPAAAGCSAFGLGAPHAYTAFSKRAIPTVSEKSAAGKPPLFSFVPPSSGMFVWLEFHIRDRPSQPLREGETLEEKLFIDLAEHGLLVTPGRWFDGGAPGALEPHTARLRISYSMGTTEQLQKGVDVLAKVMDEWAVV